MIIKKISDVPANPVQLDGADKVSARVIFGPKEAAPTFAMRRFDFEPGGHTPFHEHPFEHEVIILAGNLALVTADGELPLTNDDAVLIEPGEKHRFRNLSDTHPARMICLVPVQYQK